MRHIIGTQLSNNERKHIDSVRTCKRSQYLTNQIEKCKGLPPDVPHQDKRLTVTFSVPDGVYRKIELWRKLENCSRANIIRRFLLGA